MDLMELDNPYMVNLLAVAGMMSAGWVVSVYRRNVTLVDTLWGLGFVLIAWLTWFRIEGVWGRQLLLVLLTSLWGVRLAGYLGWRNHGKGEDPRYGMWRRAAGKRFWWTSLFKVFLLQALVLWLISLTIQAGQAIRVPDRLGAMDLIGTLIWSIGFMFETVSDWQLARFKADPGNRGRVMDRGLWRYSRHPNYFGESLIWWGLFLIALADPSNWWTVISPVIITLVLLKMTGIPLTEKTTLEKRPGYKDYIARTPAFFPWRPKPRRNPMETHHENADPVG
jgi:steroid 5-alpha reductase family enzyme